MPHDADEATHEQLWFLFGGVIYNCGSSGIGLRPVGSESFDEDGTGLDHLAFRWKAKPNWILRQSISMRSGLPMSPSRTSASSYILEFRDPDNIALELTAPK